MAAGTTTATFCVGPGAKPQSGNHSLVAPEKVLSEYNKDLNFFAMFLKLTSSTKSLLIALSNKKIIIIIITK